MADKTKIEWTDATWNIITGCTLVDEGCRNCYAAHLIATWPAIGNHPSRKGLARKNAAGEAKFTGEVRFNEQWLDQPLRWKKPRRIFVCAHGDLFHENVPNIWLDRVFAVMALCPQHTFQVLTKRPDRARDYMALRDDQGHHPAYTYAVLLALTGRRNTPEMRSADFMPMPNVWLGTSISDQASADARIPDLLATPAAVRFLSAEPLLGPVDLMHLPDHMIAPDVAIRQDAMNGVNGLGMVTPRIDWVIVGGESGPKARPMHPAWARSLRDQCNAAGVAFFFKQWGAWAPGQCSVGDRNGEAFGCFDDAGQWHYKPNRRFAFSQGRQGMTRVGAASAGRLLDGRTHDDMPGVK